jgi:hypothetical protein
MNSFLAKPVTTERLRLVLAATTNDHDPAPLTPVQPGDPLTSLRLLSSRKGTALAQEIGLYLSEFKIELDKLDAAVNRQDVAQTCHNAHLLYGRAAFIAEKPLELTLRKIEIAAASGQWDEARRLRHQVGQLWTELQLKLTSVGSTDRPV